jgi:pseudomonalisin/xanthomonalisin
MKFNSSLKLLPMAAMIASAFSAQAATNWAQTHSHPVDTSMATEGSAMQAGEGIHIAVSLQVRDKAGLDALSEAVIAGKSRPVSSAEFMSRFAPAQSSVNAVVAHLKKAGFINIEVAPNNMLVTADGSAGTAKAAFNVDMKHYNVNGRDAYAATSDVLVPQELSDIVLAVHGLQTVHMAHTTLAKQEGVTAKPDAQTQASSGHSPASWPTIYNGTGIPNAANTTIGIISSGNMTQTGKDLATFVSQAGFPSPSVSYVYAGSKGSSTSGTPEWDIDSQDSLGAAGGVVKSMVFYVAKSLSDANLTSAYNSAVSANTAQVINVSLGECETSAKSSGSEATDDQIFETAVAQGQTFAVASGDSGSYECGGRTSVQSYPAVSPYVIAVGGTSLTTNSAGVWSGETVWACSSSSTCASNGGTGGGVSSTETAPSWQKSSGVLGSSTKRGVPDIAFDADPNTGALPIVSGKATQYGGTSLATPIFVGFWARIQSAHSNSLVFPATALYQYGAANESTIFHDVTSGSNGGYSAKAGWDYTTGFGSLNVGNFAAFVNNNSGW